MKLNKHGRRWYGSFGWFDVIPFQLIGFFIWEDWADGITIFEFQVARFCIGFGFYKRESPK